MSLNHSRRLGLPPPAQVPVATHAVDVAQGDELVGVLRQMVVAPRGVQPLVVLLQPSQAGRCRRDQRLDSPAPQPAFRPLLFADQPP